MCVAFSPEGEGAVGPRQGLARRGGGEGPEGAESGDQAPAGPRHALPGVVDGPGLHLPHPQPGSVFTLRRGRLQRALGGADGLIALVGAVCYFRWVDR